MTLFPQLRDLIQHDVGQRGLARLPGRNLLTVCPDDLENASRSVAETHGANLAIVTGFFIPTAQPPAGETDGPLGALFLARALLPLGIRVRILTDAFAAPALQAGIRFADLRKEVPLIVLLPPKEAAALGPGMYRKRFLEQPGGPPTHLIALERVGPSHTPNSLQRQRVDGPILQDFNGTVPAADHDRCHTMRGLDVTDRMSPAHWLFEKTPGEKRDGEPEEPTSKASNPLTTIGIGDGGNEIGMGKIPWDILRDNIPQGARIACRIATDHLLVCGVSNWGAYALAAGVWHLRGKIPPTVLFHPYVERRLLQTMVEKGPLVDGVLGKPSITVDGLSWQDYSGVLVKIEALLSGG